MFDVTIYLMAVIETMMDLNLIGEGFFSDAIQYYIYYLPKLMAMILLCISINFYSNLWITYYSKIGILHVEYMKIKAQNLHFKRTLCLIS